MEQQQLTPPWFDDLRLALRSAHQSLKPGGDTGFAAAAIAVARRAGWDGDTQELWRVAAMMAELEGSLPQHPQRAFLDREVARFWGAAATQG